MRRTPIVRMEPVRLGLCRCIYGILFIYLYLTIGVTHTDAVCYSDSSLRTDDKTSLVHVVVKARIQGRTESGDLHVRVTKTLKGDPQLLDKRDITVTGLEAEGPVRLGATVPVVTECMQNARPKEKYILFLQQTEQEDVYNLQFDGVLNSKQELRVLRKVIESENDSYDLINNTSSSPNQTDNTPTVPDQREPSTYSSSTSHYTGCPKSGYCLNGGECAFLIKLKKYFCFCEKPWIGPRCELHDPYSSTGGTNGFDDHMQTTLITLGIIFGALLLLAIICAVAYVRYKSSYYRERREQLEEAILALRQSAETELQPLNRQPNRTNSNDRYSTSEIENINSTRDPQQHGRYLQGTRHYSLQPVHVQPPNTDNYLQRTRSDNSMTQTKTSVV